MVVNGRVQAMGILVSAAQAGELVDRHERVVRQHIQDGQLPARKDARGRWQIDVEELTRIPGWVVDRERLARMELRQSRTHPGLVARTETVEARLRAIETQLRAIERALTRLGGVAPQPREPEQPPSRPAERNGPDEDPDDDDDPAPAALPLLYRGPPTVALLDRGPDAPRAFRTRADAARWLERHGISALTPKSWPGWRHVTLTQVEVLRFALERQRLGASNWRVTWRLRRCDDGQCVCYDWLDG